ncbi:hypothetical protein SHJG_4031 [Streptomyces hygroscopicus subsp. jinggangensis 5008]|nr:hypothetical protein SHJG_4031 [Streptomyces hygroscopicus subsp. jinggangensis 5008]AGF63461.1 hypothetical protein SHJGH_3796 [Streptomyces hygroscopicus subsp. jinggangensis TL01]
MLGGDGELRSRLLLRGGVSCGCLCHGPALKACASSSSRPRS